MSINGQAVKLQGACGGEEQCDFDTFRKLIASISYVDDEETWENQCTNGGPKYEDNFLKELEQFLEVASYEEIEQEYLHGFKN